MHLNLQTKGGGSALNSNQREMSVLARSVLDFCNTNLSEDVKVVSIADLGCSSGPPGLAALTAVTEIINGVLKSCSKSGRSAPEFRVFLNELPAGNGFNTLFKYIPAFQDKLRQEKGLDSPRCFIAGVPGSFHDRLFPSNTLHFLHSSFSLHWLSQVPPELSEKSIVNKGKLYISKTSPAAVIESYKAQFRRDFSTFLKARSQELITGGKMVLFFSVTTVADPSPDSSCLLWDYLAQAFRHLVNEGVVEEESVDSYNAPYYEPCVEEVTGEIEKEGSFGIEHLGIRTTTWNDITGGVKCDRATTTRNIAKSIRTRNESVFQNHFGSGVLDALFERFCKVMEADTKVADHYTIVLCLVRKP